MVKKFQPTFDVDDLAKLPNFQSITSVMINNVPSAPFSMNWIPPMGQVNTQLRDALVRLSSAKYGKPRAVVEKEIFDRLKDSKPNKPVAPQAGRPGGVPASAGGAKSGGSSFLDEWLAKRQQLGGRPAASSRPAYAGTAAKPMGTVAPSTTPVPAASNMNSAAAMPPLSSAPTSLSPSTSSPVSPASIGTINNSPQAIRSNVLQYNNASASTSIQQPIAASSNNAAASSQENDSISLAKTPQKSPPVVNRLDLRDNDADDTEVSIKLR